jgi:hypothetical protein
MMPSLVVPFSAKTFLRSPIMVGSLRLSLGCWTLEVGAWTFLAFAASIPSSSFFAVFAGVLSVTFARRRFAHPRRQYLEIDQFVEIDRRVSHVCSLRQSRNKTSALSGWRAQKYVIVLLAVRQWVG